MIQLEKIPEAEQKDFIATFWMMLRECETKADNEKDPILMHMVVGFYKQWNRVTGLDLEPAWTSRGRIANAKLLVEEKARQK